jgi:hypothetical protein
MPATGKITVHVNGSQTAPLDLGTATFPFSTNGEANYAAGTAAGQIDRVFTDTRTLAASATENIDLAGVRQHQRCAGHPAREQWCAVADGRRGWNRAAPGCFPGVGVRHG